MKRFLFVMLLALPYMISCSGQQRSNNLVKTEQELNSERTFQLPEVPTMLTTPEARAAYVVSHYWDNFDFADTAYIHLPDITEQAIVNFMDLMYHVPVDEAGKGIVTLYTKAAPHSPMLWHFWETMSRYWYDPNSPMRDENMYILMCNSIESVPQLDETLKQRALFARRLAEKNRVGMTAEDFEYTLATGKTGRLSGLQSPYTLLLFFDPDCHTCQGVKKEMMASTLISRLIEGSVLSVLTVYPDEDVDLWKEHLSEFSNQWINAYDKGQVLTHKELYDLSALPSFYLLDKDKKVLLKDALWNQINAYLTDIERENKEF